MFMSIYRTSCASVCRFAAARDRQRPPCLIIPKGMAGRTVELSPLECTDRLELLRQAEYTCNDQNLCNLSDHARKFLLRAFLIQPVIWETGSTRGTMSEKRIKVAGIRPRVGTIGPPGIHLRWSFPPSEGFPKKGFDVFRRPNPKKQGPSSIVWRTLQCRRHRGRASACKWAGRSKSTSGKRRGSDARRLYDLRIRTLQRSHRIGSNDIPFGCPNDVYPSFPTGRPSRSNGRRCRGHC